MMMKLAELVGYELKWVRRVAITLKYELYAREMLAATLHIRGFFRSSATAESADGRWTFEWHGLSKPIVTVRIKGTETDLADFTVQNWSGFNGTLQLIDGRRYLYQDRYAFKLETGEALISYRTNRMLYLESQVEIHPLASDVPELPWMVPLGWYVVLLEDKWASDFDFRA